MSHHACPGLARIARESPDALDARVQSAAGWVPVESWFVPVGRPTSPLLVESSMVACFQEGERQTALHIWDRGRCHCCTTRRSGRALTVVDWDVSLSLCPYPASAMSPAKDLWTLAADSHSWSPHTSRTSRMVPWHRLLVADLHHKNVAAVTLRLSSDAVLARLPMSENSGPTDVRHQQDSPPSFGACVGWSGRPNPPSGSL